MGAWRAGAVKYAPSALGAATYYRPGSDPNGVVSLGSRFPVRLYTFRWFFVAVKYSR